MNLLVDALPETVTVSHTEYKCRSDFRTCIRIMLAFEDNALTNQEKQIIMLRNLYIEMPLDMQEAITRANWFLNGGKENSDDDPGPRVFSFAKDAGLIYAAFRQTHGIDLTTDNLHWWQFLALFMDLGSDTTFCNLVALRKRIKTGKATKEERQASREMGEMFELEEIDDRTLEEKEAERRFIELLEAGEAKRRANGGI